MKIFVCLCSKITVLFFSLHRFTVRRFFPCVIGYTFSCPIGNGRRCQVEKNIPSFIYDLIQPILDWKIETFRFVVPSIPTRKSYAIYNLIWVSLHSRSLIPKLLFSFSFRTLVVVVVLLFSSSPERKRDTFEIINVEYCFSFFFFFFSASFRCFPFIKCQVRRIWILQEADATSWIYLHKSCWHLLSIFYNTVKFSSIQFSVRCSVQFSSVMFGSNIFLFCIFDSPFVNQHSEASNRFATAPQWNWK